MPTAAHYALVVFAWGLTWIAIHIQVDTLPVAVSVLYRFILAGGLLLLAMAWRGTLPRLSPRIHGWLLLLGLCLYSTNFLFIYEAEVRLTSGFVAVVFSLASLFNAANAWLFFRQRPPRRTLAAAALGIAGLLLLFRHELRWQHGEWVGPACAFLGTYMFSLGNMVGTRVQRFGIGVFPANAYAMTYGALLLAVWVGVHGLPLGIPASGAYWGAMAFLVLIGSILAFGSYLTLVRRIGAARAGYATVLFPIVALSASTWLEAYVWTPAAFVGVALVLAGNVVMFWPSVQGAPVTNAAHDEA
ncbi:MAG: DMT family transporter [Acidihalobacter sp.]|uniref:DMT family transporter n=1 Tax=Acidihalobacter sp. TaxID=1872108 RepID=UPI00307E09D7